MPNGEETADHREETPEISSEKPKVRKWVGVHIKFSDSHYLASFNHNEPPGVFHNMQELLAAIEVECAKLLPGPTQT